ncbi:MAG: STAS domain-containing protein [Tildeniella nuda ZEHNDER 1965/U140]|nr:STAS domain-containing protein [Tildeniella nuda ZEHNDER 1965/U140]
MTLIHERKCVQFQPPTHLNSHGANVFQQQLAAIESQQTDRWLIDMAQVEFIDSDGILALVGALNLAQRKGCRLTVCNLRPSIQMVFEITQLDQVFDILDTSVAALGTSIAASVQPIVPQPVAV